MRIAVVDGKMRSRESLYRGQWGLARDNVGRLYYNHNSNLISADFFAAEDLFSEESTTPAHGLGVVLTAPEEVFSVRVNPGVNRGIYAVGFFGAFGVEMDDIHPHCRDFSFVRRENWS